MHCGLARTMGRMTVQADDLQYVASPSMAAPPKNPPRRSCIAGRRQRVGSSNWKDGEAAVHRRLTLERQVTGTLLPDCTIKPPATEADQLSLQLPTRGAPRSVCLRDAKGPRPRPANIELSTARGGLVDLHAYLPLESSKFAIDTRTPTSFPNSSQCSRDELVRFLRHR